MRKTRINPKLIAAAFAMMTVINTAAPTVAYAADDNNEVQIEQQVEKSEVQDQAPQHPEMENVPPVQIDEKNEDKKDDNEQNNDVNPQEQKDQDQEADPQEQKDQNQQKQDDQETDEDKENNSVLKFLQEKEKKEAAAAASAAENAAKKAKEKKLEENVNKAGEIAGKLLIKVAKTNYKNKDEMMKDVSKATLDLINKGFIKNIPYAGGFLHTIINGILEEGSADPAVEAIKANGEKLDMLNKTIKECTKLILNQGNDKGVQDKVDKLNNKAEEMEQKYDVNVDVIDAVKELASSKKYKSQDGPRKAFEAVYKTIAPKKDELDYYNSYINFGKMLMNEGKMIRGFEDLGDRDNIFELFKRINTGGKTDIVEFHPERVQLKNEVKKYLNDGYDTLKLAMTYDLANNANLMQAASNKIKELEAKLEDADEETKEQIEKELGEYADIEFNARRNANRTIDRFKDIEKQKIEYDEIIAKEEKSIEDDLAAHNNRKRNDEITHKDVIFKKRMIGGKMGYPEVKEGARNGYVIQYYDEFRHYLGEQTIDQDYSRVGQYEVKEGNIYRFIYPSSVYRYDYDVRVKVTRVYERPLFLCGTSRTVEGIDLKTNKPITVYNIGSSDTKIYEHKVSAIKEP